MVHVDNPFVKSSCAQPTPAAAAIDRVLRDPSLSADERALLLRTRVHLLVAETREAAARGRTTEDVARVFAAARLEAKRLDASEEIEIEYARSLRQLGEDALRAGDPETAEAAFVAAIVVLEGRPNAELHLAAAMAAASRHVSPRTPRDEVRAIEKRITHHLERAGASELDQKLMLADFAARSGEPGLQRKRLREALGLALGQSSRALDRFLPFDRSRDVDDVQAAIQGRAIARMTPADRERAAAIAIELAGAYLSEGATAHADLLISTLETQDLLTPLQRQDLLVLRAERCLISGELEEAKALIQDVRKNVAALPGVSSERKLALATRALQAEALVLAGLAATDKSTQDESLAQLARLREEAEKLPIDDQARAGFLILEMHAALEANALDHAEQAYRTLTEKYGDTPEVKKVLAKLDEKRVGSAEAFVKVLVSEAASTNMKEVAAVTAAGAVVGAVVGFAFFGAGSAPGAAIGAGAAVALAASSAGGVLLLLRNLVRGSGRIGLGYQTGLAAQSWTQTALNAGSAALDVLSVAAPLKGLKVLGRSGIEVIALGSRAASAEAKLMLGALRDQVERAGGAGLTRAQATELAREMLLRRFAAATADFGGKPAQLAGLSLLAGSVAEAVLSIEANPDLSPEAKMRAYEQLADRLGKAVLELGAMFLAQRLIHKLALDPVGANKQLRLDLAALANRKVIVRFGDGEKAHFDPIMGEAVVSRTTDRAALEREAIHEVTHAKFHQLSPEAREAVVRAFTEHPSWPEIDAELSRVHPDAANKTAEQKVDELIAMLHGEPGARSKLAELARAILTAPALREAGLAAPPKVDVDRLVKTGELEVGRRPYQRLSQQREQVEAHVLGFEDGKFVGADDPENTGVLLAEKFPNERELAKVVEYANTRKLAAITMQIGDQELPLARSLEELPAAGRAVLAVPVDQRTAQGIVTKVEQALRAGGDFEILGANGELVARVRNDGNMRRIELGDAIVKHGVLAPKFPAIVKEALAAAGDVEIRIGGLAEVSRLGGRYAFTSTVGLNEARGVFVEYLAARNPAGLDPAHAQQLYQRATAHGSRVKIEAGDEADVAQFRQGQWWRSWENAATNLETYAVENRPALVGLLATIRERSEPVGLELGGLKNVAEGQNAFALLHAASKGTRKLGDVVRDAAEAFGATGQVTVRGAVVELVGRAHGVGRSRTEPGRHELGELQSLYRDARKNPARVAVITVLPEDPTHGLAKTSTPDFVVEVLGGPTRRFVLVDAKSIDDRNLGSAQRQLEINKGAKQVLEDRIIPKGSERAGMVAIGVYRTSKTVDGLASELEPIVRGPIAEARGQNAPDVFVSINILGEDPMTILDLRRARAATSGSIFDVLGW